MNLLKWSQRPAVGVDAKRPEHNIVRGLVARATTPLLPDDYLHLINPLWSARELRGRVVAVKRETEDTATVRIQTGWGFPETYKPGQYVGIGLQYLDAGTTYEQLAALAVSVSGASGNAGVVALLWTNLFGSAPTDEQAAPYVAMLSGGSLSVGALTVLAADLDLNASRINLTGLATSGLEYGP